MTKLDLVRPVSTGIRCLAKHNSLERTILYKFGFYLYFCQKFWEKKRQNRKDTEKLSCGQQKQHQYTYNSCFHSFIFTAAEPTSKRIT